MTNASLKPLHFLFILLFQPLRYHALPTLTTILGASGMSKPVGGLPLILLHIKHPISSKQPAYLPIMAFSQPFRVYCRALPSLLHYMTRDMFFILLCIIIQSKHDICGAATIHHCYTCYARSLHILVNHQRHSYVVIFFSLLSCK